MTRELARSLQSFFRSHKHLLKEVADLAVVTTEEVRNFLAEGAVWELDLTAIFGTTAIHTTNTSIPPGEVKAGDHNESIHMEDHISSHTAAAPCVGLNVTVEDIIQVLQRFMREHSSTTTNTTSPYAILLKSLRDYHYPPNTLLVVVLLQIIRKLFSEAQVLKYIILYYVYINYSQYCSSSLYYVNLFMKLTAFLCILYINLYRYCFLNRFIKGLK